MPQTRPVPAPRPGRRRRLGALAGAGAVLAVAAGVLAALGLHRGHQPPPAALPLRQVAALPLPGDTSRLDYASLDAGRGLLFIAHLGASELIEVDVHANRVVRTISGLPQVHGVLVVPGRRRVYATATGSNAMLTLDEDTGAILRSSPTGAYPDGLAYDPVRAAVWTTNETGGSETVIDAATGTVRGTVQLGGDAGNVAYDPATGTMLVDVQGSDQLAVIDPAALKVTRRVPLPGCQHHHGLALDPAGRLAFIACDENNRLLTLDLATWRVTGDQPVGSGPDVLAYDPGAHRLYVAAESGQLTVLDQHQRTLSVAGSARLADGAHIVALDPATHRSYYPVPDNGSGHPALLTLAPAP